MFAALFDLACPRRCPGCGADAAALCERCVAHLGGTPFRADPNPCPAGLPPVLAQAAYDGVVRSALIAYKERGRVALAAPLGAALATAVAATQADLMVAVPSSGAARRARGYDHVGLIARRAATLTGTTVIGGLRQHRRVADQAGLDSAARTRNIQGSMRYAGGARPLARAKSLVGARVIIVDDIVTTGVTLAEAVRAMRAAGIDVVAVVVVAATSRRTRLYKPAVPG